MKASKYRMALLAAVNALKHLKESCEVEIATSCGYALDCCGRFHILGKGSERKNSDLLHDLRELFKKHRVTMRWVPFPSKDAGIYACVAAARRAAKSARRHGTPVSSILWISGGPERSRSAA
ncbi:MAG: hypothetical protein LLG20_25000 [Acidobacteriales bacterium]|nr:hypothetical protein [Terriglobales bacterium]